MIIQTLFNHRVWLLVVGMITSQGAKLQMSFTLSWTVILRYNSFEGAWQVVQMCYNDCIEQAQRHPYTGILALPMQGEDPMTTRRRSYATTYARSESVRRRSTTRRKRTPPRQSYGPIFFLVMGVTIASAIGFVGVVASVMAK
jgi:hypothetical protein